ncbi:MAG: hypothetical protein NC343_00050 [Muribaculum sp.]|nr:hypothetical protein [Muribaculaceae bacterium]MCM1080127.1 hypothetical protein [Muribaculum sp.]
MINRLRHYLNSGQERTARAKKNIVAMFFLRGVSVLCTLYIVPLTIDYVSKYEYGIWLTISSLVAWLSFFDLGIGNGMRNKVIEAIERGKHRLAKVYVSTAYAIISLVVGSVWALAILASFFINWHSVLNAGEVPENELLLTVIIVITNFSILFILGLNRTLLHAIQRPAIASAFDAATQALLCVVLWILVKFTTGNLVYLAFAMGGVSLAVLLVSNVWTFNKYLSQYRPSLKSVRFSLAKGIMSLGIMFFFIQIIAIAFYQTNNLIITQFIGPDEVTVYNISYKYMQVLAMLFTILITPFWSAYAEANVNGDYAWMRATTRRLVQIVLLMAVIGAVMVAISPVFYKIWLNGKVEVPFVITVLVYGFQICTIWSTLWTQLLCGFGKIRLQVICSTLCCAAYLPLAILGCKYYGLVGLLGASLITFAVFTSWFGVIQVHKLISRTATGIWNK